MVDCFVNSWCLINISYSELKNTFHDFMEFHTTQGLNGHVEGLVEEWGRQWSGAGKPPLVTGKINVGVMASIV